MSIVKVPSKSLSVNESSDGRKADGKAYMYLIYDLYFLSRLKISGWIIGQRIEELKMISKSTNIED